RPTISAAISSSQAEAPNAIATAVSASVRPNALRASEMSAASRMRNALPASRPASNVARPAAPSSRTASSMPGASPVAAMRLPVAAARELGDDPAGREGDAERGERTLADQFRGAVHQVAALVHERVHL